MFYSNSRNAGWSSLVARRAHNPKVGGSNPPPATTEIQGFRLIWPKPFFCLCGKIVVKFDHNRFSLCSLRKLREYTFGFFHHCIAVFFSFVWNPTIIMVQNHLECFVAEHVLDPSQFFTTFYRNGSKGMTGLHGRPILETRLFQNWFPDSFTNMIRSHQCSCSVTKHMLSF